MIINISIKKVQDFNKSIECIIFYYNFLFLLMYYQLLFYKTYFLCIFYQNIAITFIYYINKKSSINII